MPGLGTYPRHLLANTMAFNVFCHLRNDMLAPDGPLPFTLPEPTDGQAAPAVDFMLAGLPQMQGPELTATVDRPLVLDLTGPGATTVTIHPATGPDELLTVAPGADATTQIHSTALDFIAWATTRKPWRDRCRITGYTSTATPFLDRLDIIRPSGCRVPRAWCCRSAGGGEWRSLVQERPQQRRRRRRNAKGRGVSEERPHAPRSSRAACQCLRNDSTYPPAGEPTPVTSS
ncbi:hypothetical protein [Streptomyces sp. NPDC058683]|uniref:hypothetical protein n=1 Tax=Streptomyces sp. NPDC058683 TaxID=3346597 RepID=UPI003665D91D